ncbi:hypothetical protein Tco_0899745, partial [Tanacetum coccineum]
IRYFVVPMLYEGSSPSRLVSPPEAGYDRLSHPSKHYGVTWTLDYAITSFKLTRWKFQARRDTSPAPIHNIYSFYESESSESESKDVGEIDIETLTLEQYLALNLNNTRRRISNPEDATFEIKGQFLRELCKTTFSGSSTENAIEHIRKVLELLVSLGALKLIQELADYSHKWHNVESEKNTPTAFGIITDKLKALNHEMDKLRVDVHKINTNGEKKSLHEEIKSIRTSKTSYDKSYPKSNINPTNLKDTFEHYLKESCKRQDVLNEWMKKFMINTEMNFKDHDSSIKRLEENVNHLAQLISTHNLTNQERAIKLEPAREKPTLKVETFAEKDDKVLIILGRPMLATTHARIDVFEINEFDEPRNLEEFLISDDINRDLGSFLNDNDYCLTWKVKIQCSFHSQGNNMVRLARNLHVFVEGHQFLTDFIILENINEFVEKGLTKGLFRQPFKEHVGIVEDLVKGVLWFKIGDDKTIFNMPRAKERFGLLEGKQKSSGDDEYLITYLMREREGFAAALAVLIIRASQSRQHGRVLLASTGVHDIIFNVSIIFVILDRQMHWPAPIQRFHVFNN